MSTLEKAIDLLQMMPQHKLEAVYMYMCFVNAQTDMEDSAAPVIERKKVESIIGIAHEYANPALIGQEEGAFERVIAGKYSQKSTLEERQRGFQGLMSFAGTLPEDFDYKKELEEAREEKYARFI